MVEFRKGQKSKLSDLTAGTDLYVGVRLDAPGLTFDIACFGLDAGERLSDDRYFVFFNQPKSPEESIQLLGAQAGDTESFRVTLDRVPPHVNKLAFTATIDGDGVMSQVGSGYLRIVAGGQEVARYSFTGREFSTERAVMIADIYKKDVWRFSAVGQGFDGGLRALLENFGGEVAEDEPEQASAPAPVPPGGAPGFAPPGAGVPPQQHQSPPSFGPPGGGPPPPPPAPTPNFGPPPGAPQPVGAMPHGGPPPGHDGPPQYGGTPPQGAPGGYPPPPGPPQYQQGLGTPPHGAPGGYPPPPGPGGYPNPNQTPHQGHMAPPAPPGTGQPGGYPPPPGPGGYPPPGPPGPGGYPGQGQPGQMQPTLQMPVPGGPGGPPPGQGMPPGPGMQQGVGVATPEPAFQYGIDQYREVPAGGRWSQQNPKMVRVDVSGGKVIARQGVMVAYQGDVKFKFQGQSLRNRFDNRQTGQSLELMRCEGSGEVFLAEDAAHLHLVELQGNKLFVNVANVLAFDEGLTLEPARVEGVGIPGGALFAQTFTGQGTVVIKTKGIPLVLPVQGPTFADSNAIVAWTGTQMQVSTTTQMRLRRTAFPGHSGETVNLQFRCPPQANNFIVVQPYEV